LTFEPVSQLTAQFPIDLEFHAHNDFGLAAANTLAATRASVRHASVAVGGLGERADNAALEEVAAVLAVLDGANTGIDLQRFGARRRPCGARRPPADSSRHVCADSLASSFYIDLITSISGSCGRAVDSIVRERVFP